MYHFVTGNKAGRVLLNAEGQNNTRASYEKLPVGIKELIGDDLVSYLDKTNTMHCDPSAGKIIKLWNDKPDLVKQIISAKIAFTMYKKKKVAMKKQRKKNGKKIATVRFR